MSDTNRYGPDNPHPLSTRRTELVWDGKYDEYGSRRDADVARLAMPLQKIETVDEPRSRSAPGLWDVKTAHIDDFRNMLIWGDNKLVTASLIKDFRGKVDLIYIDPPFDVGADFTMNVPLGDEAETVGKDQSVLEMVAYRDTWGRGTDSYIHMIYERLALIRELLSERGAIVVHVGDKVQAPLQMIMSEVFGDDNYRNTVIIRRGIKNVQAQFSEVRALSVGNDYLLLYTKSPGIRLPKLSLPGTEPQPGKWDTFWRGTDRPTMRYELFDIRPTSGQWRWSEKRGRAAQANYERYKQDFAPAETLDDYYQRHAENGDDLDFVRLGPENTVQYYVPPRDYKLASTVWTDVKTRGTYGNYATEKNEELLGVLIGWLTQPGHLVGDLFCGSGTTGAVAEKLGRRWLMADLGRFAIHTSRKRLIEVQRELHAAGKPYRAFDVFNLGRYERQWWQKERLKGADEEHRRVVLEFYRAAPLQNSPSPLLHGRKGPALCHVDGIDSIFDRNELGAVAKAAKNAGAKEIACLAWEFEMDLRLVANSLEKEYELKIKLLQIPREIMETNRKDPPPFLEVATLTAEPVFHKNGTTRTVDIKLTSFIPSLAEVPTKELKALQERALKSGFDFIDFWAVDFDFADGGPFTHHWQDYRTRKDRSLKTVSDQRYEYPKKGRYTACVKVVDIFGADTSITLEVDV